MIKEKIDAFYAKQSRAKERKYFYVTDVAQCPRNIWYSFKNYPKAEAEPRVLRIMHNGDFVHKRLGEVLVAEGMIKELEKPIPENDLFHGRVDAIIALDNEDYIVDFKSINATKFRMLEAPQEDHEDQVQLYLHYFNMKKGALIYECKNTQDIKEFTFVYNPSRVKELLERFHILKYQIETNMLPEVPLWVEQWRCSYCPFLEACKKDGNPFYKPAPRLSNV